jgi:hypothetical protein
MSITESRQTGERFQECLLSHIFGLFPIPEQGVCQVQGRVPMPDNQAVRGRRIPAKDALNELDV